MVVTAVQKAAVYGVALTAFEWLLALWVSPHSIVTSAQERGVCYGFEGEKKYVGWFRSYLLIASMENQVQRRTTISVFDLKNRFIAFSLPLPGMTAGPPARTTRGGGAALR